MANISGTPSHLLFWQLPSKPLHYCPPSVVGQMEVMNQMIMRHSSLVVSNKNQLQQVRQKEMFVETLSGSSQSRQEAGHPVLKWDRNQRKPVNCFT